MVMYFLNVSMYWLSGVTLPYKNLKNSRGHILIHIQVGPPYHFKSVYILHNNHIMLRKMTVGMLGKRITL